MRPQLFLTWLFDDWAEAARRSLAPKLSHRAVRALQLQWRMGQAVKGVLLLLPFLLGVSFLLPGSALLKELFQGWAFTEELLLLVHIVAGARHEVSYSWQLHNTRPMLLTGNAAHPDLRAKALLAVGFGVLIGVTILAP